jgi:hypothetical protein
MYANCAHPGYGARPTARPGGCDDGKTVVATAAGDEPRLVDGRARGAGPFTWTT